MNRFARTTFEASTSWDGVLVRVFLSGELDLATTPILAEQLEAAEADHPPTLVLDLGDLTFLDVSGLSAILAAARRASDDNRRLIVARPNPHVRRLFELTALDQAVELVPALVG